MDQTELIFTALVGTRIIQPISRVAIAQNEIQKHVLPPLPIPMFQNQETIRQESDEVIPGAYQADMPIGYDRQFFPVKFSIDGGNTWFLLPYEPLVTVSGKNNVIMRNVAKWNAEYSAPLIGTIKERWSQDDYSITITGFLMGSILTGAVEDCFPRADFEKLKAVLTNATEVKVLCPIFEMLGISQITILDFTFPFTKGENVQAFDIRAVSDSSFNLLIDA